MTISLSGHLSTNTLLPQPPVKLQDSRPILALATHVRNYSSTECTRPKSGTSAKTDNLIATSCQNSKTRTNAATANDALIAAVYDDMIQEINHYIESNPDALNEFTRLGPMLLELKEAFRVMRNGSEEDMKLDAAGKKLGELSGYSDWKLPEHLKKLDEMWDSLWNSRREITRITNQKVEWCGRWCGEEGCPQAPETDKIEQAKKMEDRKPGDEKEELKMRTLNLLSQQLRANRLLVQQVKDQKLEQDDLKLRLLKTEQRLQKLEGTIYDNENQDNENGDHESVSQELRYQRLLSEMDPQGEDGRRNTSTRITPATADDLFDEQQRLDDAWRDYESKLGQGKKV